MKASGINFVSSETVLVTSILIGIAVPPISRTLGPYLYVFVFLLMLFSLLTIDLRDAVPDRRTAARLVAVLAWQMILLPAGIGLWHRFGAATGEWSELVLITACAGTIFSAPAFARVMRLDTLFTLRGVLAGTLLMPLVLPLLVPLFAQRIAEFDVSSYVLRFLIFIVVPLSAAYAYQTRRPVRSDPEVRLFDRSTIAFLALFGIAIMDGIGVRFVQQPGAMLGLLGFAFAVHALLFALSALLFLGWGRQDALTAGLLSGYRNLAVVLVVGGSLLPPDFIVFVALWQIPMYITPLIVRCSTQTNRE